MKVKAGIERVGVATNYRNPDDSLDHAVNTSVKLYIIYRSTRGSRFKRARSRGVRFSRATAAAGQKAAAKPHRLNVVTSYVSRVETISPFI